MDFFYMLLRWFHFLAGITWIGILYYFNFVQVPFFAETDPAVRSGAVQKLVPRALWWFRWGAMVTVIMGVIYLLMWWGGRLNWEVTSWTVAILTGGTMGIIMFLNVWLVIWPNQQIVIASAVTVAGGGQADPKAAPAGRRAGLTSRTNTVFSIPMLFFMGAAQHFSLFVGTPSTGGIAGWLLLAAIVIALVEINALRGTTGPTKQPLDSVSGAITSGFVLWLILLIIIRITMG